MGHLCVAMQPCCLQPCKGRVRCVELYVEVGGQKKREGCTHVLPLHTQINLPLPIFWVYTQVYKVETAGDCYIVAGALMQKDEDGFLSIDNEEDAGGKGAEKVMAFAKVGG